MSDSEATRQREYAHQQSVVTNDDLLRRQIEREAEAQASDYLQKLNRGAPSARSNRAIAAEDKEIQASTVSWIKKMKKRGWK
jgi:hypothetical protein